jgi:hypothetical protein
MLEALAKIEEAMLALSPEIRVEVNIRLKIHDDVPADFVEQSTTVMSDSTDYRKVVQAFDGMVHKEITLSIPD